MTKVKSNAEWNKLTPKHRTTLESWLFDDCLSYQETLKRAQKEFAFTGSIGSIRRFYERTAQERQLHGFTEALKHIKRIESAPLDEAGLSHAAFKCAALLLLQQITEHPANMKHWLPLARLVLRSEENQKRDQRRQEANAIHAKNSKLAREKFEFDAMEHAKKVFPKLEALKKEEERKKRPKSGLSHSERIRMVRLELFGSAPGDPVWEAEEAERKRIEAEKRKKLKEQMRKDELDNQTIAERRKTLGLNDETENDPVEQPTSDPEPEQSPNQAPPTNEPPNPDTPSDGM